MYELFYDLNRSPFCLFYERDLFFESSTQLNAQEFISDFINGKKAIISIQGPAGLGKTTLIRQLVDHTINPSIHTQTYYFNCTNSPSFANTFIQDFNSRNAGRTKNVATRDSITETISNLNNDILLIIDDSQRLSNDDFSFLVKLLTYAITNDHSIKFFLISNAETDINHEIEKTTILKNSLVSCRLTPFSSAEVKDYIKYRLHISGWKNNPLLSDSIFPLIYKLTGGIPRRINSFMDRLLTFAEFEQHKTIDNHILIQFCIYLHSELAAQKTHDHDSSDLFISLGNNLQLFINASTIFQNTAIDSQKTSAKEELTSIINLVINFRSHPERYKHLSDGIGQLPVGFNRLINYISPHNGNINSIKPFLGKNITPNKFCELAQEFILKTVFSPNANEYRALGLNDKTELVDAKRNYNTILSIINQNCNSKLLPDNPEEILSSAYTAITTQRKPDQKPDDSAPVSTPTKSFNTPTVKAPTKKSPITKTTEHKRSSGHTSSLIVRNPKNKEPVVINENSSSQHPEERKTRFPIVKISAIAASLAVSFIIFMVFNNNETTEPDENMLTLNSKPVGEIKPSIQDTEKNTVQRTAANPATNNIEVEEKNKVDKTAPKPQKPTTTEVAKKTTETKNSQIADNKLTKTPPPKPQTQTAKTSKPALQNEKPSLAERRKLLDQLIADLVHAYKKGNINSLSTLFVENAITNERRNRNEIITDFKKLFQSTKNRDMQITDLQWNLINNITTATGNFTVSSYDKKSDHLTKTSGELFIHAKSINERPKLQAFIYNNIVDHSPKKPTIITRREKIISEKDLDSLIDNFITYYDQGNIKQFSALFTENATTNDSSNRSEITKSYQQLFAGTSERNIQFKNLSWQKKNDAMTGVGTFSLLLKNKTNKKELSVSGEIFIDTKLVNDQAKINSLHYRYSLASNE